MRRNTIARCLNTGLFVALLLPAGAAFAQGKANAPRIINSIGDTEWKATQATTRPWTREEMMSAISLDEPRVSEIKLQEWSEQAAAGQFKYDVKGGPGFYAGGEPGGVASSVAPQVGAIDDVAAIQPTSGGYTYPAPFTRYEAFPSTATAYSTYPFITVGKVFFKISGVSYVCSASSIGGDAVLTAGHCVHSGNTSGVQFYSNFVFVPAYKNGSAPYGQWTADHLWVNGGFVDNNDGDFRYDLGGAVLTRKSGVKISSKVGFLGFAWNQNNNSTSAHWALLGYPHAAPFNGSRQYVCQASFAYQAISSAPAPFGVGCDLTGGVSGGPWVRSFAGTAASSNYVNGLCSYRRCFDNACSSVYSQELFSPYFDNTSKKLRDCLVNSTPGHPANSNTCLP